MRSEFAAAINQICSERGIEPVVVLDSIKTALLAAYKKDYGTSEELDVLLDPETGEARIIEDGKDVTPPGFGRIAAQTAKQVILQKIREAEKDAIIGEYQDKIGNLVNGMVVRFDGRPYGILVDEVRELVDLEDGPDADPRVPLPSCAAGWGLRGGEMLPILDLARAITGGGRTA